jgi:hypothetical protein
LSPILSSPVVPLPLPSCPTSPPWRRWRGTPLGMPGALRDPPAKNGRAVDGGDGRSSSSPTNRNPFWARATRRVKSSPTIVTDRPTSPCPKCPPVTNNRADLSARDTAHKFVVVRTQPRRVPTSSPKWAGSEQRLADCFVPIVPNHSPPVGGPPEDGGGMLCPTRFGGAGALHRQSMRAFFYLRRIAGLIGSMAGESPSPTRHCANTPAPP